MQKRCAPAASAARACSSIWSGSIIACSGVSASAYFDWAQNPQSSAQPPDFALTSEHMSVASPKRSRRVAGQLARGLQRAGLELLRARELVDQSPAERRRRVDPAPEQEQLPRPGRPDDVDELADPGVGVDEPELRRWHPELDRLSRD